MPLGPSSGTQGANGGKSGVNTAELGDTSLPVTIRRLTNAEYDETVKEVLGIDSSAAKSFAPDVRNRYYTQNIEQRVDETRGDQLQQKAAELAQRAVSERFSSIVPCSATAGASCATTFIDAFASKAFRRPVSDEEREGLLAVFNVASTGGTFNEGVQAVITAVLQSASFLYIPQIGAGDANRLLDPYEVASAISYFALGAPPDAELLEAAAADQLKTGEQRKEHFLRLIESDERAVKQMTRFVREWLGLDHLDSADRIASGVDFASLRPLFAEETEAFVREVVFHGEATLTALLNADFTMTNPTLASFYKLDSASGDTTFKRTSLTSTQRRGITMQGAFLAAHASRDNSAPVKRGTGVLRRLLCRDISFPTGELALVAMQVPPPSPNITTRERFLAHSTSPACASCHRQLDPIGFAFEHFNQVGQFRSTENGKTVDASGTLAGTDFDGSFTDATELVVKLSESQDVRTCFARNLFRFASAQSADAAEQGFLAQWAKLPADKQDNVIEILGAFVSSDQFVARSQR